MLYGNMNQMMHLIPSHFVHVFVFFLSLHTSMSEEATLMKTVEPMISSFIIVYVVAVVIILVVIVVGVVILVILLRTKKRKQQFGIKLQNIMTEIEDISYK